MPEAEDEQSERDKQNAAPSLTPPADIEAILWVLTRLKEYEQNDTVPEDDRIPINIREAYLEGADLYMANLRGVYFDGANLDGANLEGAFLRGANLAKAEFYRANLYRANLQGAVGLTQEQLAQAFGDETTNLPELLAMPKSWTQSE